MIKIYHNPRCKKSRAGLEYLKEKTDNFEIILYLKTPLNYDQLNALIKKTGLQASELIRTQEDAYKKELKGKDLNNEEWIKEIEKNPKLLKRPIIEIDDKAVWADPPQNLDQIYT